MDSNKIKNLATGVRTALRVEVSSRLDAVLAPGSTERLEHVQQVIRLEQRIAEHGREEVVDSAAYTWFNRLCALRFMDARGYTPVPVVTPRAGTTQPAVLADAAQGVFDPELGVPETARQRIAGLLLGSIPSANPSEDAYEELLDAVCTRYAKPMPYLFSEDVASTLLMPRGLLAQGSILTRIVSELDADACSSVEVLGWLYQFYIAERKDEVFAGYKKGKKAQSQDIAPATQLFTPEWIVRYITENSLGRLWMLNNPYSELASSMEYYIAPEGDEPYIEISSAEDIRVLDPACGSGHILVYAFDLLYRMYEEEGWLPEDIPAKILTQNLAGLEIDRRAAEIASFALEMKALERDPRFLDRCIDADIRVLEPVELTPDELLRVPQLAERRGLLEAMAHMDEVGSLYVPDGWDAFTLDNEIARIGEDRSLFSSNLPDKLEAMRTNVEALSKTYHCVIANPPYMGSGNMNPWLSGWVKANYLDVKSDLFSCFIVRNLRFAMERGELGFMTPFVWMFIASYEKLRKKLIVEETITSLIQLEYSGFAEATVPICSFTLSNHRSLGYRGGYVRLSDFIGSQVQGPRALEAIRNPACGWFYRADADDFKAIPGWPIAYWASEAMIAAYSRGVLMRDYAALRVGLQTGKNDLFIRLWWEPSNFRIEYCAQSRQAARESNATWFPYNKGGQFRKWYGNFDYLVNWQHDGELIRGYPGAVIRNPEGYFKKAITWTDITSSGTHFRFRPEGSVYDVKGMSLFVSESRLMFTLALCNSSVASTYLKILAPTISTQVGDVGRLPVIELSTESPLFVRVQAITHNCIVLSRTDWDSFETSWDFTSHPLARTSRIADAYALWEAECRERFDTLKSNEEELNRIFARIYGMEGEVPIEVPDDKVSVRLADRARDARSLISYGVGCMLGRYSAYVPGLILADQGQALGDFREKVPHARFLPDADNVLPVLADEWFEDDIVAGFKSWLADTYGAENLDGNVAWLEGSIGTDLRSYFCKGFYEDHVKVYQKRPIYWMFSSPKGAFRCLVYMHRYDEGTVGTILTGYLRPLEDKLRSRIQALSGSSNARDVREADRLRAQLAELEEWEREVVYPLAHERVSIDLDDGVKVNYNRFPKALAKVAGLSEWK